MRGKKSNNRAPSFSMVHIALLILCAVLITTHLTGGIAARYTSETTATASASVIKFGNITLTETGDFNSKGNFFIIPGVDIEKEAVIHFAGSESATYVFLKVDITGWETEDYRHFYVDRNSTELLSWDMGEDWTYLTDDENAYIYYYKGSTLAPNTVVDSLIIAQLPSQNGEKKHIAVSEHITVADITNDLFENLSITFCATAVQSIGFDSVEAAWTSISGKGGQ